MPDDPKTILDLVCLMTVSSCTNYMFMVQGQALGRARNTQARSSRPLPSPPPPIIYLLIWTMPRTGKGRGRDWWDERSGHPMVRVGESVEKINLLLRNLSAVWTWHLKKQGHGKMEQPFRSLSMMKKCQGGHSPLETRRLQNSLQYNLFSFLNDETK